MNSTTASSGRAWQDDENRSRLGKAYQEQEATDRRAKRRDREFATTEADGR